MRHTQFPEPDLGKKRSSAFLLPENSNQNINFKPLPLPPKKKKGKKKKKKGKGIMAQGQSYRSPRNTIKISKFGKRNNSV